MASKIILKDFIYLLLERGGERTREKERHIDRLPLARLQPGTRLATQAWALTRNRTGDLLFCRMMPNPLSHIIQGAKSYLNIQ